MKMFIKPAALMLAAIFALFALACSGGGEANNTQPPNTPYQEAMTIKWSELGDTAMLKVTAFGNTKSYTAAELYALDRRLEGANDGFFYPIDAEGTRITGLCGDNGIFSNYKYFHAEIDGLFMKITNWQCGYYDVKSFDFGNVREALEQGLIRTFDAE